jgi:hypothetical protein
LNPLIELKGAPEAGEGDFGRFVGLRWVNPIA